MKDEKDTTLAAPKGMPPKKHTSFLKCSFSEDEIKGFGGDLARLNTELQTIKDEKKAVVADFTAQIDAKQAEMNTLSTKICNGHEHRYVECTTSFNDPETGQKTTRRNDNGELVSTTAMTASEMQYQLELDNPKELASDKLPAQAAEAVEEKDREGTDQSEQDQVNPQVGETGDDVDAIAEQIPESGKAADYKGKDKDNSGGTKKAAAKKPAPEEPTTNNLDAGF